MKRFVSLAKHLPAVLCGLLVLAWVGSIVIDLGILSDDGTQLSFVGIREGSVECSSVVPIWRIAAFWLTPRRTGWEHFGKFRWWFGGWTPASYFISLPISALLTLLLPVAIGCVNRFRFPLWSWFAFTALVAVELAYYLR